MLPEDIDAPHQKLEFVVLDFNDAFLFSRPRKGFFFEPFDPHTEAALVSVQDLHYFSCLPEKYEIAPREYRCWLFILRNCRKSIDLLSHIGDSRDEINSPIFP